jgi:transposase-like protein
MARPRPSLSRINCTYRASPTWPSRNCGCLISVHAITTDDDLIDDLVNARGHFPTETAALKCVYLAIMSLDPTGRGRQRWSNRWKEALNALEITFDGRLSANRK